MPETEHVGHVTGLGYIEPSLILFIGHHDDRRLIELVQHVSKISFLLTVLRRMNPDEPRRKIGFAGRAAW